MLLCRFLLLPIFFLSLSYGSGRTPLEPTEQNIQKLAQKITFKSSNVIRDYSTLFNQEMIANLPNNIKTISAEMILDWLRLNQWGPGHFNDEFVTNKSISFDGKCSSTAMKHSFKRKSFNQKISAKKFLYTGSRIITIKWTSDLLAVISSAKLKHKCIKSNSARNLLSSKGNVIGVATLVLPNNQSLKARFGLIND